jgi:MarR family 2-MHQ and catechol resistance regulon transcriptional repressor
MQESTTPTARRRALRTYVTLMRAADAVTRRTHGHLADDDLTTGQFAVLEALLHLGPQPQHVIGRKVLSSPGNLTTVLDNLERRELVERRPDAEDRRRKRVVLTRSGRRLIQRVFRRHTDGICADLARLDAREQSELARLCKKLGLRRLDS